jgi:hypothetical protein
LCKRNADQSPSPGFSAFATIAISHPVHRGSRRCATLRASVASKLDAGGGSTAAIVGASGVCLSREISRDAGGGGMCDERGADRRRAIARLQANAEMTFSVESYRFAGGGIDDGGTASISLPA